MTSGRTRLNETFEYLQSVNNKAVLSLYNSKRQEVSSRDERGWLLDHKMRAIPRSPPAMWHLNDPTFV